jgi:glycosyltransferase involved in cell wall biosynthesis
MVRKMLVSIVTPSLNQAQFLEETIQSVFAQDYPDIEYIIIDGQSNDGSVDIIKKYEDRLAYWVSEKDKSHADALNKGFAKATGEIFAWINSDDTYLPGAVSGAVRYMQEHPDVGMVYGDANYIDKNSRVRGLFPARQTSYARMLRGFVHIPQQATFFRADLWRKVGGLDPDMFFSFDYDLWVRFAKHAPIVYYPRLWANFRIHGDAKTWRADDRCWPDMIDVQRREGGSYISVIRAKYILRRLLTPLINWNRRRRLMD